MKEKKFESVEKVLGAPFPAGFPDEASKVRRNLFITSVIALVVQFTEAKVSTSTPVFGFQFVGLTDEMVSWGLTLTISYQLAHFIFFVIEHLMEWRLRVTGTRTAFITGAKLGKEHADYPDEPRQSTLYHWWVTQTEPIGSLHAKIQSMHQDNLDLMEKIRPFVVQPGPSLHNDIINQLAEANVRLFKMESALERMAKTLESERIPTSLARFNNWFHLYLRVSNFRSLVIEILTPLLIASAALYNLIR